MNIPNLRSPRETVGGLVHFGRMLDKIRLHAQGKLPPEYHKNLGIGFDGRCVSFLKVEYPALVERVQAGGTDEEVLAWCFEQGHKPGTEEIASYNTAMANRGRNDEATAILQQRLTECGMGGRTDIATFFDFIDADEGRL